MFKAKKKSRKKELADLLMSGEVMPASELAKAREAKTKLLEEFEDAVIAQQSFNKTKRLTGIVEDKPIYTRKREMEVPVFITKKK